MRKTKTSYRKRRLHDLLWQMIQKFQSNCIICGLPFTEADLPSSGDDLLTEHHENGLHEDSRLCNRSLVHRACHKRYHVKDNINSKEKNFWRDFE